MRLDYSVNNASASYGEARITFILAMITNLSLTLLTGEKLAVLLLIRYLTYYGITSWQDILGPTAGQWSESCDGRGAYLAL